jgi:protein-S-isoprenylcysteine O-methyltransferase Ste14
MIDDPHLVVRGAAVYLAAIAIIVAVIWRRPDRSGVIGASMALAWNVPAVFVLHLIATRAGWWWYDADGGVLIGLPVDLWLTWAILWGPATAIAMPGAPLWAIVAAALAIDLVAMPAAAPVVQLGSTWLVGEAAALVTCLVPAQLLARWTAADRHLPLRATLQLIAFGLMLGVLLPIIAIDGSDSSWANPVNAPRWWWSVALQVLCIPALIGVSAVQEFVTRGLGTPVPFDPPRRIVTTGPYAYVANPMQLSAVLLLLIGAVFVGNVYVALAGVMAHIYSVGLAGWDEDQDLRNRFGAEWVLYRLRVRTWIPRWRPAYDADVARLYVAGNCTVCQEVAHWFTAQGARGLSIVPAETCPLPLTRITYTSTDGAYTASGVAAIGRALEHIHFGWAMIGFAIRLPIVCPIVQLIVDASGGGPREPIPGFQGSKGSKG